MESLRRRRYMLLAKWAVYSLVLLGCAVLQTTPLLFQWGEVKLIFILPFCAALATQEGEFASSLFGMVGGLLWDYTAGHIVGVFAILFMTLCFCISLMVQMYLRCTLLNFWMVCMACNWVALSTHFLFFYLMPGYQYPLLEYGTVMVPTMIFSAIAALPLFLLVRYIAQRMNWQNN